MKKYFDVEDWELEEQYSVISSESKSIRNYTGLNLMEIEGLPYYLFCLYKRDAWLYSLKQSEDGRRFLKELRDLMQADPDYNALRKVVKQEQVH